MRVAGLISGTSVDGIDVAVVDIGDSIQVVAWRTVPYAPEVREAILSVSNATTNTASIARLNFLLGELFAEAVKQSGVPLETIQLIGSHGQTIFHEGEPVQFLGRKIASTFQIGDAAIIADRTGIETIADFRPSDIAAGGKGAPLVPFLDYQLFKHPELSRIALNIGGIANVTVIPANAKPEEVIAFDTGPGNMVMDALAPPFDRDGERARGGRVDEKLLEQLLADPYYRRDPPKSCGREQYGAEFVSKTGIDVATATELTVQVHRTRHRTLSGDARSDRLGRRRAQHLFDGAVASDAETASHDVGGIRYRRGCQRGDPVRGPGSPNVPWTPGQPAIGHRSAQTGDSG